LQKFQLSLLIHAHQPVGNFENVFESAYNQSYLPFLETLARHPSVHIGLHYSGCLLEWIERAHPEYFDALREFVRRGQVEIVGGGFYEPILIAIPVEDRQEQIRRLADYIEKHFERRPTGAWLTERVWEPQLPSSLASAGVEYTLVDDNHFLGAGFDSGQLYGYYKAEDQGHTVNVLPGLKSLRYLIPFRGVEEVMEFLRKTSQEHPHSFAAMGDDLEKFGIWPGTYEHCYKNGWLRNFFAALESNSDWLATATPSEAIASHPPQGRADLPTASYQEMMEWSLPTPARNQYHGLIQEFSSRPADMPFLRGGIWRNFFSKYSESNLLHKKMLHVSGKVRRLIDRRRREKTAAEVQEATTLVLRSQCNDAYWHGVFGGLYSPHLRTAAWRSLVEAEAIADRLSHKSRRYTDLKTLDFDADGQDEIYLTSERCAVVMQPHDGGTICEMDCRSSNVTLINSLMRRPESYHAKLRNMRGQSQHAVQSIHEQTRTKEEGLDRWLNYDRWPQHSFRLLLFGRDKTQQDCATARLEANPGLAAGQYSVTGASPERVSLASLESPDWPAQKHFSVASTPDGFAVTCDVALKRTAEGTASLNLGIEVIVNFLAPSAPDRYFESGGQRFPLRWSAAVPASQLRVVDEWQKVGVTLVAPDAREFWITPIETVSESEDGFERIYQGSKIVTVWPVELARDGEWQGQLTLKVASLGGS
jgi:4-alpha-glucanotransferase